MYICLELLKTKLLSLGTLNYLDSLQMGRTRLVSMNETLLYTRDLFGLKSLDERGSLHLHQIPDMLHNDWLVNKAVFVQHVLPLLS